MSPVPQRNQETAGGRSVRPTEKKQGGDVAVANHTSTFTSPAFNIEDAIEIDAQLSLAGLAGGTSPSVAFQLQCSQDGTTWVTRPETPPALTANGTQNVTFSAPGVQARWVVTVTGAPTTANVGIDHQAVLNAI